MKISVILCTYNGAKYLSKQLDSILNQQSHLPDEIIVCDDISTDNTLQILTEYTNLYPTIFRIHENEVNLGSTKNFEKALSLATGDFIFLADQDDIWKKDKTAKIIQYFQDNPKMQGVFTDADFIDQEGSPIGSKTLWECVHFFEKEYTKPIDLLNIIALNGNIATGATMCITKEAKATVLPFVKKTKNLHDEVIAKKLSFNTNLGYLAENLISYRLHQSQQVGVKSKAPKDKKIKLKRILLGLNSPKTIFEKRYLFNKYYSRYSSYLKFKDDFRLTTLEKEALNIRIADSRSACVRMLQEIKKDNPIYYYGCIVADKIAQKRQL
ncbi:glycosyltransferase family 2 protein [Flavobacterium crassostreae]|nr:glycosyltransferase family 2 protein [Flavobacterium crassostreae]